MKLGIKKELSFLQILQIVDSKIFILLLSIAINKDNNFFYSCKKVIIPLI